MLKFVNGKFQIENAPGLDLTWSCRGRDGNEIKAQVQPATAANAAAGVLLDLSPLKEARCEIGVPAHARFTIDGMNGKISFAKPKFHVTGSLENGKIDFDPDGQLSYKYETQVTTGKVDEFTSSNQPDAFEIKLKIANGKISH